MASLHFFKGLFRRFRSLVLQSEVQVIGQCKMCGACCKDILLQYDGRWLTKEKQFQKLCKNLPEHQRMEITGRDETGCLIFACKLQAPDGLCSCHDTRLPLCSNYPPKSLYYQGGWLRPDCGYSFKAKTFRDVYMKRKRDRIPKFSEVLKQERQRRNK